MKDAEAKAKRKQARAEKKAQQIAYRAPLTEEGKQAIAETIEAYFAKTPINPRTLLPLKPKALK